MYFLKNLNDQTIFTSTNDIKKEYKNITIYAFPGFLNKNEKTYVCKINAYPKNNKSKILINHLVSSKKKSILNIKNRINVKNAIIRNFK